MYVFQTLYCMYYKPDNSQFNSFPAKWFLAQNLNVCTVKKVLLSENLYGGIDINYSNRHLADNIPLSVRTVL